MSAIIHATSAAGKTRFCNFAYGPRGIRVVDGDDIIAATVGYPKNEPGKVPWWHRPGADEIHLAQCDAVMATLLRNDDLVVAWNTSTRVWYQVWESRGLGRGVVQLAVCPPESVLRANYEDRERRILQRDPTVGHSTRSWESYRHGREKQLQSYHELGIPVSLSFTQAARKLGLYVKKGYEDAAEAEIQRQIGANPPDGKGLFRVLPVRRNARRTLSPFAKKGVR